MMTSNLFEKYQPLILGLCRHQLFRDYLGIKEKEPILKISPNSHHSQLNKTKSRIWVKSKFYGRNVYLEKLGLGLTALDILNSFDPKTLLNYLGLGENRFLPASLMFTTANFTGQAGYGRCNNDNQADWGVSHDAASSAAHDALCIAAGSKPGANYDISRMFLPFDTSSLPDVADIGSSKLYFYRDDAAGATLSDANTTYLRLVLTTQANPAVLANSDYSLVGTTAGATDLTLASLTPDLTQFYFTLNSTGIGWISKTGSTKLGMRIGRDVDNAAPTGNNVITVSAVGHATREPYLEVIYTLPGGGGIPYISL